MLASPEFRFGKAGTAKTSSSQPGISYDPLIWHETLLGRRVQRVAARLGLRLISWRLLRHIRYGPHQSHVLVAFLGYALWVTLKHLLLAKGSNLSPMQALAAAATLHTADIVLPIIDGREIRLRRVTTPTPQLQTLFAQRGITHPSRLSLDQECSADLAIT